MFNFDPWQTGPGLGRNWRPTLPLAVVAVITLGFLFQYGSFLVALAQWFLEPDGDTTLILPEELVLARLPWSLNWNVDRNTDGVLIDLPNKDNPAEQVWSVERWPRPWIEGKREPFPAAWRDATQPDWRNDEARVCQIGLETPVTRDGSLLAAMYYPSGQPPQTRIIALPSGKELARLKEIPAGGNGKCIVWHPTENILAIGTYGSITLTAGPDWVPHTLATTACDRLEWQSLAEEGEEETGYYPNENVSQLLFSDDGAWLITAMNRGMRVYDWQEVRGAIDRLPAPRFAVEGTLVKSPIFSSKMTYAVAYDARRRLVLWSDNDSKLKFLNLASGERGTLWALANRYCVSRMHLCAAGDGLICEIMRIMGKSAPGQPALVVLDYPKLLQHAGAPPEPRGDAAGKDD